MTKLPVLSGREVIKILKKAGWTPARQKGSHIILVKHTSEGKKGVVVPNHKEVYLWNFGMNPQALKR
jgi:predicted RNA binding protein YcfA (HicA-like mRNA interferase family)